MKINYIWQVDDLDVQYTPITNGGGDYFALEYAEIIHKSYGSVSNALEWCSGPGFIGYALLASKLCNNISFVEMSDLAINQLTRTKENSHRYINNINIYKGNRLDCVPSTEKFNLVVGNPPHWPSVEAADKSMNSNNASEQLDLLVDTNWEAHKDFFKQMKNLLAADGRILLQECTLGSGPNTFEQMINEAGLKITAVQDSIMYKRNNIYYMEVKHA
jgi:methylase of polypeptide subunit release factors|tara:strand:- start:1242 stop:1892 length:651 start_codon:yes stop_codon:yes gene_type:complete